MQHSPVYISRTFSSSQTDTLYPLNTNSISSLLSLLATFILSVSKNSIILSTSYKQNHQYLTFCVWLVSRYVFRVHLCCSIYIRISFLFMTNSQLHGILLSIHSLKDMRFFHFLTIVNNASMNIGIHVSVWILVFNFFVCVYT